MESLEGLELGSTPLSAIIVLLSLNIVVKVGQFLWDQKAKRDAVTETGIEELSKAVRDCTSSLQALQAKIEKIEPILRDVTKIKLDLRRVFFVLRNLAGEKWTAIRSQMLEEIIE
jgi:hypothetical protein